MSDRRSVCVLAFAAACYAPAPPPGAPSHRVAVLPEAALAARRTLDGDARWASPPAFTLHNRGTSSFLWVLEPGAPWLSCVSPRSGLLAAGGRLELELAIAANLAPKTPGLHHAEVAVLNAVTFWREASVAVTWIVEPSVGFDPRTIGGRPALPPHALSDPGVRPVVPDRR
jgi:hypothetical protein